MSDLTANQQLEKVAPKIIDDLVEFYTGGSIFFLYERSAVRIGSNTNNTKALMVTYLNEDTDKLRIRILETSHLNAAFLNALQNEHLCCPIEILQHGVGMGCSDDVNVILQYALFEELIYA